jgi:hypothetical protein
MLSFILALMLSMAAESHSMVRSIKASKSSYCKGKAVKTTWQLGSYLAETRRHANATAELGFLSGFQIQALNMTLFNQRILSICSASLLERPRFMNGHSYLKFWA